MLRDALPTASPKNNGEDVVLRERPFPLGRGARMTLAVLLDFRRAAVYRSGLCEPTARSQLVIITPVNKPNAIPSEGNAAGDEPW